MAETVFDGTCSGAVDLEGAPFRVSAQLVVGNSSSWAVSSGASDLQVRLVLTFVSTQREEDYVRVYDSGDATGDLLLQLTGREIVDAPPVHSSAGVLFVELAASTLDDTPLFAMNTYASGVSFEWATFDEGVCPRGCSTPNGTCVDGVCICEAGFAGSDCSSSRCSGTTRREVSFDDDDDDGVDEEGEVVI